jgi:D-alanyl-D-alanine carboxypeptidase
LLAGSGFALLGSALLLSLRLSRDSATNLPMARLQSQRSRDGRLLGHFPYPEANEEQLVSGAPGMKLHRDAAASLRTMEQAATADGVPLVVLSAFRSVAEQEHLFFAIKAQRNQTSQDRAKVSAPPGFSEHSTGYAIDVGDPRRPQSNLSPTFAQTATYQWLLKNAARYQFALSFPLNNPQGVSFEPWHWRYEGSVDALRVFEPAQRLRSSGES